ncbi:MAG: hypothetical protein J3Q66DRAFT_387256 [Benniella sp.]|nr:MAG: hypothetical protein J3Q66DRAFT_387256 [Benniella sp.]
MTTEKHGVGAPPARQGRRSLLKIHISDSVLTHFNMYCPFFHCVKETHTIDVEYLNNALRVHRRRYHDPDKALALRTEHGDVVFRRYTPLMNYVCHCGRKDHIAGSFAKHFATCTWKAGLGSSMLVRAPESEGSDTGEAVAQEPLTMKARHSLLYNVDVVQAHSTQLHAIAEAKEVVELRQRLAEVQKDNDYLKNMVLELLRHADKIDDNLKSMGDIMQLLVKRDTVADQIRQSQGALDRQFTAVDALLSFVEASLAEE